MKDNIIDPKTAKYLIESKTTKGFAKLMGSLANDTSILKHQDDPTHSKEVNTIVKTLKKAHIQNDHDQNINITPRAEKSSSRELQ